MPKFDFYASKCSEKYFAFDDYIRTVWSHSKKIKILRKNI